MKEKTSVAVIFGGKSAEHEVSLQSAKNIIDAIDKKKYAVTLIGVDKQGRWFLNDESQYLLNSDNPEKIELSQTNEKLGLIPGEKSKQIYNIGEKVRLNKIDVAFPVLHGPFGEDGTMQGLLKLANIPFVGACVLGSAVGMDKDVSKRLLRDAGLPIAEFLVFNRTAVKDIKFKYVKEKLGMPVFIKPANLGSSVGVSKVNSSEELSKAIRHAFKYDNKIIIEENIIGREIECSVLGNENPIASLPGEILPQHDFYSYEAKYLDEEGSVLEIPAKLQDDVVKKIQDYAIDTFKVLCCEGMARVDFFLRSNNEIIVNEINTIPGFTKISMYPKLWETSGISYPELIDRLIEFAIKRHDRDKKLKVSVG